MLDIRYIVGSLIITVAVVAFAISMIAPVDRNQNASLKPRIEPSRIAAQPAAPKTEPVKQTAAPAPAPAVNASPAPKQATVPAQTPAAPAPKQAAAPAKAQAAPAPEITGTIAEPKPAPKRVAPAPRKQEPEYQFQWPWLKGWQQN